MRTFHSSAHTLSVYTQLLFPVLMIVMVWRTISVRIHPNERLLFRLYASGDQDNEGYGGLLQAEDACPAGEQQQPTQQAEGGERSSSACASEHETEEDIPHGLWQKVVYRVKM